MTLSKSKILSIITALVCSSSCKQEATPTASETRKNHPKASSNSSTEDSADSQSPSKEDAGFRCWKVTGAPKVAFVFDNENSKFLSATWSEIPELCKKHCGTAWDMIDDKTIRKYSSEILEETVYDERKSNVKSLMSYRMTGPQIWSATEDTDKERAYTWTESDLKDGTPASVPKTLSDQVVCKI